MIEELENFLLAVALGLTIGGMLELLVFARMVL